MAGLLKYFKLKWHNEGNYDEGKLKGLPDPNGELSKWIDWNIRHLRDFDSSTNPNHR